jgi:hypothetical protein
MSPTLRDEAWVETSILVNIPNYNFNHLSENVIWANCFLFFVFFQAF